MDKKIMEIKRFSAKKYFKKKKFYYKMHEKLLSFGTIY